MKKTLIMLLVALMAMPAFARGPYHGPGRHGPPPPPPPRHGPVFRDHHYHYSHTWHSGDWLGLGLATAAIGTVAYIASQTPPPPPLPRVVYAPAPASVVVQQPVVVQRPVVVQPARYEVSRQTVTTQTTVDGITTTTTRTRINYSDGTFIDL